MLLLILFIVGCSGSFDQHSYDQANSIKTEALILMDKGKDSATVHSDEINELLAKLDKAYEYEKARSQNEETTAMWKKLKSPKGNLLGGFITLWKQQGVLSETYITEKKKQIGQAFDEIIELESKKPKN